MKETRAGQALPSRSVPSLCSPRSPSSSSSSQGDCHMIAKKWHINEAPLQGSFLLLSPLKTIRWFEGGHGGSHLAQRSCRDHSSALRSSKDSPANVRAQTPQPSSAARRKHSPERRGHGGSGCCRTERKNPGSRRVQPSQDAALGLRAREGRCDKRRNPGCGRVT